MESPPKSMRWMMMGEAEVDAISPKQRCTCAFCLGVNGAVGCATSGLLGLNGEGGEYPPPAPPPPPPAAAACCGEILPMVLVVPMDVVA